MYDMSRRDASISGTATDVEMISSSALAGASRWCGGGGVVVVCCGGVLRRGIHEIIGIWRPRTTAVGASGLRRLIISIDR